MERSETIKELTIALCKFHGEVEKIKKTETNPFFKNKYADLSSILSAIDTPLCNNGLVVTQHPTGEHELETMLLHISGEHLSSTYKMKPTKDDPQGLGSTITYQRRYALGAILGLNIDIDDDGNKGSEPVKKAEVQPPKVDMKSKNEESKLLVDASDALGLAKSLEELKTVWNMYPDLQANTTFKKMTNDRKLKLTPQIA